MDQSWINCIMYKNIAYNFILIFIIIKYVESQDNDPDQPADDEEEEDNFEVLDIEQIIQERISRFDDPQYQPQYQQLQESQYQPQPQTQPQQYPGYQPEYQYYPGYQPETSQFQPQQYPGYQSESFQYQPETSYYQPQQYGQLPSQQQLQTPQFQSQTQEQKYYVPPPTQPTTQVPQLTQESQYQYYGPQSQDPYGYQQPYGTQTLYDTGHQPLTEIQPQVTQLQQPEQFYETTTQPTQPIGTTEESYQYYEHTTAPQTSQQQPIYQYYEPPSTQPQTQPQPQTPTQPPITQPPQPQPQTIEDDDNFYVTEHDQAQQVQPQKKPTKRKKPKTTQQIQPPSGDEDEEEGDEQPIKLKKPRYIKKTKHINFYKRDNLGNLVEMNESDYNVTHNDEDKTKYLFNANLEQIESDGEIIFEHLYGTPYFSLLTHSKRTNIHILTNGEGFVLIKKIRGQWIRTDAKIPDYVNIYTQDSEGNEVLLTKYHYTITFTSNGSFKYTFLPGVNCTKIIVNGLLTWEKTEDDEGFPLVFYITPKISVIVNFEKYFKLFERKARKYRHFCTKSSGVKPKYL